MLVEPGEGVGGGVVGADLEVEVAGGAGAVIADVGDVLSGAYLVPNLDQEAVAVHVAETTGDAVSMVEGDQVSVSATSASEGDGSCGSGVDGGAAVGAVVLSFVEFHHVVDGVHAVAEASFSGGNADGGSPALGADRSGVPSERECVRVGGGAVAGGRAEAAGVTGGAGDAVRIGV